MKNHHSQNVDAVQIREQLTTPNYKFPPIFTAAFLVGGFNPSEKYESNSNSIISPSRGDLKKKTFESTTK